MAITIFSLHILRTAFTILGNQIGGSPKRIMSLGYPDILASPNEIRKLFGSKITDNTAIHPDSEKIIRWHHAQSVTDTIYESRSFFSQLGYELEVIDITQARGDEIVLDLNEPCPVELHQRYSLVIDGGTCEHCFNIAQAVKNLANMVCSDGYVYHCNPINYMNHGFYMLSPTFYYDFYQENGFTIEAFRVIADSLSERPKIFEVPAYDYPSGLPERSANIVIARRKKIMPINYPIQTKYKNSPNLHR